MEGKKSEPLRKCCVVSSSPLLSGTCHHRRGARCRRRNGRASPSLPGRSGTPGPVCGQGLGGRLAGLRVGDLLRAGGEPDLLCAAAPHADVHHPVVDLFFFFSVNQTASVVEFSPCNTYIGHCLSRASHNSLEVWGCLTVSRPPDLTEARLSYSQNLFCCRRVTQEAGAMPLYFLHSRLVWDRLIRDVFALPRVQPMPSLPCMQQKPFNITPNTAR